MLGEEKNRPARDRKQQWDRWFAAHNLCLDLFLLLLHPVTLFLVHNRFQLINSIRN